MALSAKETELFKDAFVLFDREATGSVSAADLEVVWTSMGRQFAEGELAGSSARCVRVLCVLGAFVRVRPTIAPTSSEIQS